ncbi:MAG: glycosyltransferase family 2 protein [Lachnospiraceae bacterium]|nr:glycosyltransferase family 2 protein [Lachnospiraceae bacterium]MEE3461044.1 glycosyltransferase family 2 protein [Lachnospiraceae bacterium]
MKKIVVLMSTYNGSRYLKEQLDSIFSQDVEDHHVSLKLLVRDDGSKDATLSILQLYKKKYPFKIEYYSGKNLGVIGSFFDLMKKAEDADYYAFSDQDDVWDSDKLSSAIDIIDQMDTTSKGLKIPFLYACAPELVSEDLEEIHSNIDRTSPDPEFENALVENICIGCTEVFNDVLLKLVRETSPDFTIMHDWWLYLTASCFGKVFFDDEPHIKYRQHHGNALGMNSSHIKEFIDRVKRFKQDRNDLSMQAAAFVKSYTGKDLSSYVKAHEQLIEDDLKYDAEGRPPAFHNMFTHTKRARRNLNTAEEFVKTRKHLLNRISFLKDQGIFRQRSIDDIIFKFILISGKY